ncbi:50S ribosomal protein L25 [Candidatus Kaiserbacteria bacterium]|nr:MAG: 50S ribosomal protein L25 [Candidatus Kaiserbacteria bacterium]
MLELNIKTRDAKENIATIREAGGIPAVFYGPKEENTPIALDAREFVRVWGEAGGSTIVDLKGVGEDKEVLIHEVTKDPVKGNPIHVDFYCIERGKKLTVSVPLEFVGEAPVEKIGGIVVKVMHEIEIEVQPRNIPHSIEVDLSPLTDFDSSISIADLNLDETIEPTADVTENVASVTQAKEEPKEEEEERDISDIEIESKGKEEDAEEEVAEEDK